MVRHRTARDLKLSEGTVRVNVSGIDGASVPRTSKQTAGNRMSRATIPVGDGPLKNAAKLMRP